MCGASKVSPALLPMSTRASVPTSSFSIDSGKRNQLHRPISLVCVDRVASSSLIGSERDRTKSTNWSVASPSAFARSKLG
jgi:hypothetical protein